MINGPPRLLVSVRDADEAHSAIEGGADIIDIKEPSEGSLGRASLSKIRQISNIAAGRSREIRGRESDLAPLSIALGEIGEWSTNHTPRVSRLASEPCCDERSIESLASEIAQLHPRYLKLGLSDSRNRLARWQDQWIDARCKFEGQHEWVAVAYADHQRANSPSTFEVLDAALETNCSVLLLDTFIKDKTSLRDWLSHDQLASLRKATAAHRIHFALAGKITLSDLPSLLNLRPDIVAVRGAVCDNGLRTAKVCKHLVAEFRAKLLSSDSAART